MTKPTTKKTDEDHIAMRRIEFESSLYLDPEQGPYLPGPNIARALLDGQVVLHQIHSAFAPTRVSGFPGPVDGHEAMLSLCDVHSG